MFRDFKESAALVKKYSKSVFIFLMTRSFLESVSAIFNTVITGSLINSLIENKGTKYIFTLTAILVVTNLLIAVIRLILNSVISTKRFFIDHNYQKDKTKAYMSVNYDRFETVAFTDLRQNILYSDDNMGTFSSILDTFSGFFDNLLTLISSFAVIVTMIAEISFGNAKMIWILFLLSVVVFCCTFIVAKLTKREQKRSTEQLPLLFDAMSKENRTALYFAERIVYNYGMGKDIRIYNISELIRTEFQNMIDRQKTVYKNICLLSSIPDNVSSVGTNLIGGIIYIALALFAAMRYITVGSVVVYANNIQRFISSITSLLLVSGQLSVLLSRLTSTRELFEMANEDTENLQQNLTYTEISEPTLIEFKNVWFKYPLCDSYVLEDVSFKVSKDEKISIVGENGAGKSTIVKLLCKLYHPEKGKILINGIDIWDISEEAYQKTISTVFQDFKLFSFSLGENLSLTDKYDEDAAKAALIKVGFENKLKTMPNGLNSILFHDYEETGIECSGGELQKIALARCLYSKSNILILDEPTSALDARAEAEVFENFNTVSKNKIVIYISHRLSSCRFCDRIIVINNGRIVQVGSHDELMEQSESVYQKLWNAQAGYYQ